ncbi:MAG: DUF3333 domain-containing protein, partial [Bauldia sp.]
MADIAAPGSVDWSTPAAVARRRRRHGADRRLRMLGIGAILLAVGLLAILIVSLAATGYRAFVQTMVTIDFPIRAEYVSREDPAKGNYRAVIRDALRELFPDVSGSADERALGQILTNNAQFMIRDAVVRDPAVIGGSIRLTIPASDIFDQLDKGVIDRATPESQRRVTDRQIAWFDQLAAAGHV